MRWPFAGGPPCAKAAAGTRRSANRGEGGDRSAALSSSTHSGSGTSRSAGRRRGSAPGRACGRRARPRAAPRRRSGRGAILGRRDELDAASPCRRGRATKRSSHRLVARHLGRERPAVEHARAHALHVGAHLGPRHAVLEGHRAGAGAGAVARAAEVPAPDGPVDVGARAGLRAVHVAARHDALLDGGARAERARVGDPDVATHCRDLRGPEAGRRPAGHDSIGPRMAGRDALDGDRLTSRRARCSGRRGPVPPRPAPRARSRSARSRRRGPRPRSSARSPTGAFCCTTTGFTTCGATAIAAGSKTGEARSATTRGRAAGSSFFGCGSETSWTRSSLMISSTSSTGASQVARTRATRTAPWRSSETPLERVRPRAAECPSRSRPGEGGGGIDAGRRPSVEDCPYAPLAQRRARARRRRTTRVVGGQARHGAIAPPQGSRPGPMRCGSPRPAHPRARRPRAARGGRRLGCCKYPAPNEFFVRRRQSYESPTAVSTKWVAPVSPFGGVRATPFRGARRIGYPLGPRNNGGTPSWKRARSCPCSGRAT